MSEEVCTELCKLIKSLVDSLKESYQNEINYLRNVITPPPPQPEPQLPRPKPKDSDSDSEEEESSLIRNVKSMKKKNQNDINYTNFD